MNRREAMRVVVAGGGAVAAVTLAKAAEAKPELSVPIPDLVGLTAEERFDACGDFAKRCHKSKLELALRAKVLGPWCAYSYELVNDDHVPVAFERFSRCSTISVMEVEDFREGRVTHVHGVGFGIDWPSREAADAWLLAHGWTLDVAMDRYKDKMLVNR
jgi:hypothetical protein